MKFVDTSNLPRVNGNIYWRDTIGYTCNFVYENMSGEIEIVDFKRVNRRTFLTIKFESNTYDISSDNLSKGQIGGVLNKYNGNFKIEIGTIFKDDKRNLYIIDREYRKDKYHQNVKWYKYHCNNNNHDGWIVESSLLKGIGCGVCSNMIVLKGINDIATTDPWMIEFLANKEDAYNYTSQSGKKILMKCPYCNRTKNTTISDLYKMKSISCICSDRKSYPEKFMYNILKQLKQLFICQYNKCQASWCENRSYDFYLSNLNIIIETHGGQHSKDSSWTTKDKQQKIDKIKRDLALSNGIHDYIELDCSISDVNHIKNSILNSTLVNYFDFDNINWYQADEFATKNFIKDVCEYYENNKHNTLLCHMADNFHISYITFLKYIKHGHKFKWCQYDKISNYKNSHNIMEHPNNKAIIVIETSDVFKSATECERKSEELYGVKFNHTHISMVCSGKQKHHKGYHFRYFKEE